MLSSCSSYKLANGHVHRKLERAGMTHYLSDIGDNRISYWDNGSDKPVLLLVHGFGSTASFQWFKQIAALTKDYRIIMPNLLYFGQSKPLTGNKYQLQDQVDVLSDLLNELKVDSFHLCGVSYGGLVSAELAREYPEKLLSLTLFDAPLKFYGKRDIEAICTKYGTETVQDFFVPKDGKGMKTLLSAGFKRTPPIPALFLESFLDAQYLPNSDHLKNLLIQLQADEVMYAKRSYVFEFPVLLIWGEDDDIVSVQRGQQLHEYLIGSEFHVIPKTKHLPNLDKPRAFNKLFIDFLNRL